MAFLNIGIIHEFIVIPVSPVVWLSAYSGTYVAGETEH